MSKSCSFAAIGAAICLLVALPAGAETLEELDAISDLSANEESGIAAARDLANARVAADPRMTDLIAPLTDPSRIIFDATRMVYGGFEPLVQ